MATDRRALLDTLDAVGLRGPSWSAWRVTAKVIAGLPLTKDEQALYEQCTGRTRVPTAPVREALFLVGRRGGKSRFAGALGVHAASQTYALAPGERAVVGIAASDRAQASVVHGYCAAPFRGGVAGVVAQRSRLAALASLLVRDTRTAIDLSNGVSIEVTTASFRRARGRTFAAAICDEVAFWQDDATGANPAAEVLGAIRPALATLGGPLVMITTPWAKSGVVYEMHERYYGVEDAPVLVWRAPSRTMNPLLPQAIIDEAMRRDEQAARAEYLAEFRDDLASFVSIEVLKRAVLAGHTELPPRPSEGDYAGFSDFAGGSGADEMVTAVAHGEQEGDGPVIAVLDALVVTRPPFSPERAIAEHAEVLRRYGVAEVTGDAFGGEWPREAFRRHGIEYRVSAKTRSDLYRDFLIHLNSDRVRLLDVPKLLQQFQALQRRATPGGRDSIDHGSRGHDDLANAAAGALALVHAEASVEEVHMGVLGR